MASQVSMQGAGSGAPFPHCFQRSGSWLGSQTAGATQHTPGALSSQGASFGTKRAHDALATPQSAPVSQGMAFERHSPSVAASAPDWRLTQSFQ